jgi:NAD(P)-dependent dehydrogenase (short-subunit alcohol dehydrogenase family)
MSKPILVYPSSVVLVSGGARGITAECVIKLAERAKCKFILLGRSSVIELPPYARNGYQEADLKRLIMEDLLASGSKPLPLKSTASSARSRPQKRSIALWKLCARQAGRLNISMSISQMLLL